jgi:glycosyltransferase involved in cell wall biosynthesis
LELKVPVLSIITVAAFDTQRLQKTLDSLSSILSELVEHVVIHPNQDSETRSLLDSREYTSSYRHSYADSGVGIYPAMNIGIEKARGKYVWFINSGDELITNEVAGLLKSLEKNRPTWLIGKGLFDWREDQEMHLDNLSKFLDFNEDSFISHQTVLIRTQILRNLGCFDVRYKVAADTDLIARIRELEPPMWFMEYIVKVEQPEFASAHNRRARFETLLLSIRLKKRRAFLQVIHREFSNANKRIFRRKT